MVDGSGRLGTMLRVTLPLVMPGLVTALIFTFIAAGNERRVVGGLTAGAIR